MTGCMVLLSAEGGVREGALARHLVFLLLYYFSCASVWGFDTGDHCATACQGESACCSSLSSCCASRLVFSSRLRGLLRCRLQA